MKVLLSKFHRLSLLLSLAACLTHCGKTSFDKGSTPAGSAAVVQTAKSNDIEVEEDDLEATVASEPVSVGGAFLACSLAATQPSNDEAALQCEFSSRELTSSRAQGLLYAFTTGTNRAGSTAIAALRQDLVNDATREVWVWNFYFPRSGIVGGWLYVDIQDRARIMDASIKADVAVPTITAVPPPPPPPPAVAAPAMFRFNGGAQKIGDDGAGVGVETGCVGIDVPTISFARSKTYTVALTVESSLTIVFSNLCGVGTGLTNTAGAFTTAALRNANGTAVFQFNLANQMTLTYVSAKVPAGVYSLVVTPASRNGALNDFAYSGVMIEGAGISVK